MGAHAAISGLLTAGAVACLVAGLHGQRRWRREGLPAPWVNQGLLAIGGVLLVAGLLVLLAGLQARH